MNSTPDISDKFPDLKFLNIQFKSFGAINFFYGQIVTAICPEDNSKIKKILNEPGNKKVLIVDGQASFKVALLGDLIADAAVKNNWSGVIINGCVRDVEILKNIDLGLSLIHI